MKSENVSEYYGIKVGDTVVVTKDAGFQAGVSQQKKVKQIKLMYWTTDERLRMNLSFSPEPVFVFTDDSTAGPYDSITRVGGKPCWIK